MEFGNFVWFNIRVYVHTGRPMEHGNTSWIIYDTGIDLVYKVYTGHGCMHDTGFLMTDMQSFLVIFFASHGAMQRR